MGTIIKPYTFSNGTDAEAPEVNANFDTIYNEFNGNIAAANIASNAITTAKVNDSAITTAKINDSAITTAKIADDAVTAAKIDWASTGANGGIWWEEIGRTTLGSAGDTISVTSLPARKYLKIMLSCLDTGGTINMFVTFNNDSSTNYARRTSADGGADSTNLSASSLIICASTAACPQYAEMEIFNIAADEKVGKWWGVSSETAGAANAPARDEGALKWANTSDQITRIDVTNSGTGDFASGSEVVVLGHN